MESQQDHSQIVDMEYLDHAFRHFPDKDIAATLRRQILLGCKVVEGKQGEVVALQAEVQALKRSLEAKLVELEVQEQALKKEKAKHEDEQRKLVYELAKFNDLTKDLPSKVEDFTKRTDESFVTLKSNASGVADKVEAFGKATSEKEEASRLLNQDISTKLKDLSASTETNTSDLSSIKDKSSAIVAAMDSVEEYQRRIESSLKGGVTIQGMKDQIKPLVELANTSKKAIDSLPTVAFFNTKFDNVGRLAELLERLQIQATELGQENQTLRNQNENLITQRDQANSFSEQARSQLEENEETLGQKESSIEELQTARDDLLNRLTEANLRISQGEEARRQLDEVQHVLQTAETQRQELAEVRTKLQQAEQTAKDMEQKIANLQRRLDREKGFSGDCSEQLTQALTNNSSILLQKTKLETECSEFRNELRQLRSQDALDLQQQMKNQWATVEEALQKQLSDKRSHEETILKLNTAWDSERKAQQTQISDKDSLIERQNKQLETLQSRVSQLEPLGEKLQKANYKAEEVQRELTASEEKASQFEKDYEEAEAKIDSLRDEVQALQHQVDDSTGTIKGLEEKLITVEDELSTQQSHQCVTIPQGVHGDLAKIYLRLADVFSDIPVVPETEEGLDMAIIAVEMASLLDGLEAKDNLTTFLNSDLEGWHCLRQVINGEPDSEVESGDIACDYHKDHGKICTMVRVVQWDTPRLEFHQTR